MHFIADSVCCDTTWLHFFYVSEQHAPGNAHSAYAGDNHRIEVGGLCSICLTCCVQARSTTKSLFFSSCRMSLLSSASFFFFSLRSVAFHQHRCSAQGAAELAAFVIEVCVVFCSIVCLCAGDCACRFTIADTTASGVTLDEVSFSSACRLEEASLPALSSPDEVLACRTRNAILIFAFLWCPVEPML